MVEMKRMKPAREPAEAPKKKRIRSPNFPFMNIEKALEFVKHIYDRHDRHFIPLEVVASNVGLSVGGYLNQYISAFSQFGLIDIEGEKDTRKIKVSDSAWKIFVDERPISNQRDDLIRQLSLNPTMFQKMYAAYPNSLPPDTAGVEYNLKVDYGFNPKSVKDFIECYKTTMEFANLYDTGYSGQLPSNAPLQDIDISVSDTVKVTDSLPKNLPVVEAKEPNMTINNDTLGESFPITLKDNKKAVLSFSSLPIKKADIELIKKFVDLMADNWSETE